MADEGRGLSRSEASTHAPDVSALPDAASGRAPSPERSFVADVLHDCLSSFQGLDHSEGVCCFDRDAAVEYLLSPASGLRIEVAE